MPLIHFNGIYSIVLKSRGKGLNVARKILKWPKKVLCFYNFPKIHDIGIYLAKSALKQNHQKQKYKI